ncbi:hypothetical protein HYZ64_03910 [Candidatus Berkelbacteria bacterium]|nr:hypothetical protein [Candidatus Berkelbacteria bacterium]
MIQRLGLTIAVSLAVAGFAIAQTPAPDSPATSPDQPITEDQLNAEEEKAFASLPPAGVTRNFWFEDLFERPRRFFKPGEEYPKNLGERLSEATKLEAEGNTTGAERMMREHARLLERMQSLARTRPELRDPFNTSIGQMALCYRKLEDQLTKSDTTRAIFEQMRGENLQLAALINPETPPEQLRDALVRANVVSKDDVNYLKNMEQVVAALERKRADLDEINRETLRAMVEASLARNFLQKAANGYVADQMARLTAKATLINQAIEGDRADTIAAMVNNYAVLMKDLNYDQGFGTDPFSRKLAETIDRLRKGQKVDFNNLLEDDFRGIVAERFKAIQEGQVDNPNLQRRYLGIVNNYYGRSDVDISGFNPEEFRRSVKGFYDPERFKKYDELRNKIDEESRKCYSEGKNPYIESFEEGKVSCRNRSYIAGPSPDTYREWQERCRKENKSVRWTGEKFECYGTYTEPHVAANPCPQDQFPYMKSGAPRMYDDAARTYIPGSYECRNQGSPGGSYTPTYSPSPSPGSCPPPGAPASEDYGINPSTGQCEPHMGGHTYSGSYPYTSPPTSTYGSPTTPCDSGKYWVQRGGNWGCENYVNSANPQQCPSGFYYATGVQPSCWNSSGSTSSSPPNCGSGYYWNSAANRCDPNTSCPSSHYWSSASNSCKPYYGPSITPCGNTADGKYQQYEESSPNSNTFTCKISPNQSNPYECRSGFKQLTGGGYTSTSCIYNETNPYS